MLIPRRSVRTSQPQHAVGIDLSNHLTLGIISAVHAPSRSLILPTGSIQRLSQNTAPNYGVRSDGVSLEFDGTNNSFVHSITPRSKQEITFVAWFYQNTSAVADKRICAISLSTASSGNHWSLGTGSTDGTKLKLYASNQVESSTGLVQNNVLKKAAATFGGTMEIYDNGALVASGTPAISMSTFDRICYGSLARLSNAAVLNGGIVFAAAWNRRLSAVEIKSVSENPWQIFEAEEDHRFVPAAGSGSTLNAAASGGATTSGTASLAAQVALAAIGVSSASGAGNLSASIPLSAAGLSVSDGSADASATVTLSAADLAQAAGQAGLSASVLLAGAGAAQAAGNATLAAQLNALAAGAAQAGGSANLTGGAPGALSASGGAAAAGSAVLSVTVGLVAAGSAQAGGIANGQADSPGSISASGGAQSAGSATWAATISITAAGFIQAMGSGQWATTVSLSAFAASNASGSGTLADVGNVVYVRAPAGSGAAIISPSSIRSAQREMTTRPPNIGGRRV